MKNCFSVKIKQPNAIKNTLKIIKLMDNVLYFSFSIQLILFENYIGDFNKVFCFDFDFQLKEEIYIFEKRKKNESDGSNHLKSKCTQGNLENMKQYI